MNDNKLFALLTLSLLILLIAAFHYAAKADERKEQTLVNLVKLQSEAAQRGVTIIVIKQ